MESAALDVIKEGLTKKVIFFFSYLNEVNLHTITCIRFIYFLPTCIFNFFKMFMREHVHTHARP